MPTTNLALPLIAEAQAQKHVTHNDAIEALDALLGARESPAGVVPRLITVETGLTLTGASVTAPALFLDRDIMLGVVSRVTTAITGATAYRVGDGSDAVRFGSTLGISAGAENVGVIGPTAIFADNDIIVAAEGPDFTGGAVRLTAIALRIATP